MKKIFILLFFAFGIFTNSSIFAQCGPTDHSGADWTISSSTTIGGEHINIGTFMVNAGVTVTVDSNCHFLEINADTIIK